jgi:hypothetical protein
VAPSLANDDALLCHLIHDCSVRACLEAVSQEGCSRARLHGSGNGGRPAACLVAGVGGSRDGIHAPGPRFHVAVIGRRAVRTLADGDEGGDEEFRLPAFSHGS